MNRRTLLRHLWFANGILLFLFLVVALIDEVASVWPRDSHREPAVSVIDDRDTPSDPLLAARPGAVRLVGNVYLVELRSDVVMRSGHAVSPYDSLLFDLDDRAPFSYRRRLVNVVRVDVLNGTSSTLFEENVYIPELVYAGTEDRSSYVLSSNLLRVVREDSNEDGVLSRDDLVELYTSNPDGTDLRRLAVGVTRMNVIGDDLLAVYTAQDDTFTVSIVDLATRSGRTLLETVDRTEPHSLPWGDSDSNPLLD